MSHGNTPWAGMVDEVVKGVRTEVEEIRNDFGPRHDRLYAVIAEGRRDLAAAREELATAHRERNEMRGQLDDALRRLAELESRIGFLEPIAQYIGLMAMGENAQQSSPTSTAGIPCSAPRPPSIDRACAVDQSQDAQRVDLPQYGLVAYPEPDSTPEVTWGSLRELPLGEGTVSDKQLRASHSSRTSRR